MEEQLISKKELLVKYGISYGALYRWKRMGLIPEEWFFKRAVSTGQETFFPLQLISERVELIQSRKDAQSLQELAEELSGRHRQEPVLLLQTSFGEKRFPLRELQSICLLTESGERLDLTDTIFTNGKDEVQ